jgi:hypothetical protein
MVTAKKDNHKVLGTLPDGTPAQASVQAIRPQALIMLKLWGWAIDIWHLTTGT